MPVLRELMRLVNVLLLAGLVSPTQEHQDLGTPLCEIDPVSGAVAQPQFKNALPDRLHVTSISVRQSVNPLQDSEPALAICRRTRKNAQ